MDRVSNLEEILDFATGIDRVNTLLELASLIGKSAPDRAIRLVEEAVELAGSVNYPQAKPKAFLYMSLAYWVKGDSDKAIEVANSALRLFQELDDQRGVGEAYRSIGRSLSRIHEHDRALESLFKAVAAYEAIEDQSNVGKTFNEISYVYWVRKEFEKSFDYSNRALEAFRNVGDEKNAATILGNMGVLYLEIEQLDMALEHCMQARAIWDDMGELEHLNAVHVFINLSKILLLKGDCEQSLKYGHMAEGLSEAIDFKEGLAQARGNMGLSYFRLKDYAKAEELLKSCLEISRQIKNTFIELEALKDLAVVRRAQQSYEAAFEYLEQYDSIKDKLHDERRSALIAEMEARFESERNRKEAEIYRLKNVELAGEIKERKKVERELSKYQKQLQRLVDERTQELEQERTALAQKNIALNQILEHLETKRQKTKREVYLNLEKSLLPFMDKLADISDKQNAQVIEHMSMTLRAILDQDMSEFKDKYARLSPREMQICMLLKKGLTSKQVADALSISLYTVKNHREQIRKKLGITNKHINLASFLKAR
ncbi:MAG: tetratricopeptide repeat protein [bacterium]